MSFDTFVHHGKMIIITAPSGAGKTTIMRHLLKRFDFLDFSVSATTRPIRAHETEGKDYFFKTMQEFRQLIETDELIEWEEVYENKFYGTLKSEVDRIWNDNKHIIFDIDVKGAVNLQSKFPNRSLSVFIKPPSVDVLLQRLQNRKTETPASLARRINKAKVELTYEQLFDKVLINDDLAVALKDAEKIIQSYIFGEEE